ncbi:MAG: hypothetical protein Q7W51_04785 [Coriobacteriia bacterium]|nr:hypothetical protein [Coriobacteriia bacterium]
MRRVCERVTLRRLLAGASAMSIFFISGMAFMAEWLHEEVSVVP